MAAGTAWKSPERSNSTVSAMNDRVFVQTPMLGDEETHGPSKGSPYSDDAFSFYDTAALGTTPDLETLLYDTATDAEPVATMLHIFGEAQLQGIERRARDEFIGQGGETAAALTLHERTASYMDATLGTGARVHKFSDVKAVSLDWHPDHVVNTV